jgi:hypothetical protein
MRMGTFQANRQGVSGQTLNDGLPNSGYSVFDFVNPPVNPST